MEGKDVLHGRLIGLTGPSGSGKSSVSALIREWDDVLVIDADAVAHAVMEDASCRKELVEAFGPAILTGKGTLDRRALAAIVFRDPQKLVRLGEISYPHIIAECIRRANEAFSAGARAAFLDAPTLFESGADRLCNQIVSVVTNRAERLRRILQRDGISPQAAEERMKNQFDDAFYADRSDFVIHNDSDWDHLRDEVERCRLFLNL